mmetsp:Transcript_8767/g.19909  ORF Transcript_8767/g.19909 Transcript_8767/m.19909 type:complete len:248 (+) Transcript_8767:576-1319(+)
MWPCPYGHFLPRRVKPRPILVGSHPFPVQWNDAWHVANFHRVSGEGFRTRTLNGSLAEMGTEWCSMLRLLVEYEAPLRHPCAVISGLFVQKTLLCLNRNGRWGYTTKVFDIKACLPCICHPGKFPGTICPFPCAERSSGSDCADYDSTVPLRPWARARLLGRQLMGAISFHWQDYGIRTPKIAVAIGSKRQVESNHSFSSTKPEDRSGMHVDWTHTSDSPGMGGRYVVSYEIANKQSWQVLHPWGCL